ncbi:MAG: hypothetical protein LBP52_10015 [Burkholderiaceae bacterium]|jgi:hypothetical protein|nr:hypothetical protein [Burkholderiaceae bacterium]
MCSSHCQDIVYLNARGFEGPPSLTRGAAPRARNQYLYEPQALEAQTLGSARALLIHAHIDQRQLTAHRAALEDWLLGGGTLVFNGHVAYPFLRWLQPFVPQTHPGLDGLRIERAADHPIFEGVQAETLTFRRGVAGFYSRGSNPPPAEGARVLNTVGPNRMPVDWVLGLPGGGRMLVHSGNDIWSFTHDSAARLLPQLLDWIDSKEV